MIERVEGAIIPDGWSYLDNTASGGRIHVVYQETHGDQVNRIRIAFAGKIAQFLATVTTDEEAYTKTTIEGDMARWLDNRQC